MRELLQERLEQSQRALRVTGYNTLDIHVFCITMSNVFLTVGQSTTYENTEIEFWKPREAIKPGEEKKQSPHFSTPCPVFHYFEEAVGCSPEMMVGWGGRTERRIRPGHWGLRDSGRTKALNQE